MCISISNSSTKNSLLYLQRFPNRNISTLSRDELLKLFSTYAVPKARRNAATTDVEMTPVNTNGLKRNRHQMISAPTVETVTNACKKIRLINNTAATQKRPCQPSPMVSFIRFWSSIFLYLHE